MLVRVRSKDGLFRITVEPADDIAVLINKLLEVAPNADSTSITFSNDPRGTEMAADQLRGNSLADLGISHGHLLYASYSEKSDESQAASSQHAHASSSNITPSTSTAMSKSAPPPKPWQTVVEDPVDKYWEERDGMIPRSRDAKFCRHGDKAMCDYCMPLEPYDAKYQAEHSIKHISFHSYLKKLDVATNVSKPTQTYIPPLDEPNYSVRVPCPSGQHPSWPAGICTKCQPSAITLQSQEYRMVDHVEFAHPQLIENLLAFWRSTGTQRYGFLLGHCEPYDVVPMGIKVVVEAIHEPPQEGEVDGITLGVPWEDQARVESLAASCGMSIVGQIYTDLTPADPTFSDPEKAGKVLCKRHKDSFFLSSLEALFAAQLQGANPNPCKYSLSGKFGSKFVTCVLSGTPEGAIDVSAYQISEQGVGMVKSDMIEASVKPSTVRVKPASSTRYVPEVFYRYKNEYKIEVKESAKPTFPVEYLLVTLTHGFPNTPNPRFLATTNLFPIENRPGLHDQSAEKMYNSIAAATLSTSRLLTTLSDWHLLSFLQSQDLLEKQDLDTLCQIAAGNHSEAQLEDLLARPAIRNLLTLAEAHSEKSKAGTSGGGSLGGTTTSEPMGDYAADDYIPPEAMEGYQGGHKSVPMAADRAPAPAATVSGPAAQEIDEFTYTGDDDEDDGMAYDEDDLEDDGVGDGSDMFDDASSTLSAENGLQAASISGAGSRSLAGNTSSGGDTRNAAPSRPVAPSAGVIACPHCTFENEPGSRDCDVCGLPLNG